MLYSFSELADGGIVGVSVLEITTIPDISIATKQSSTAEGETKCIVEYKHDFAGLLRSVAQSVKNGGAEVSLELLWASKAVDNQAYKADVKLYILIRCTAGDREQAEQALTDYSNIVRTTLNYQKYEYAEAEFESLKPLWSGNNTCLALVKEETIANLQNNYLNECYAFDVIPESELDLSRIANAIINYPDSYISFQLVPTRYSVDECQVIDQMTTSLETLHRGINERQSGNIGFALAEKYSDLYKYYSERKQAPLFSYAIHVSGNATAVNDIGNTVYSQLNSGKGVSAKLLPFSGADFDFPTFCYSLPWVLNEFLLSYQRNPIIWQSGTYASYYRLPYIVSVEEASEFFRLPVGSSRINAGFKVNFASKDGKTYSKNLINSGDITVGKLKSSSQGDQIGFSLKDLTKHMLVVGTPGSGKTTFSVSLLDRLWKQHGIPFLVIEPAKNEYRALVQSIPDLQIFTPGKNHVSPFYFNPFVPPENVKLESYKSVLKTAFAAAVTMATPLDKIFEETVNNCYSDFRWLDSYTTADKGRIFNIQDFVKCFQKTFEAIGYTGDARNIGRAGVVRLNSLVNLFDNYFSVPIADILSKPTVIELAAIENAEQKALIIALLLLNILSYVNANYVGRGDLRNVLLIEEAHVLLDSDSKASEGAADPSKIAKGLVKRMLAEIRSYGVGIVVADQSPRKVGTDIVALTNIKLAFRLVEREDKEIFSDSTNMTDVHRARLARLRPGEAMLFFDKLDEPEEVVTPDYRLDNGIDISLADDKIAELSLYWKDKQDKLKPYPECAMVKTCGATCDFARRQLAREMTRRLYNRFFTPQSKDAKVLVNVLKELPKLVRQELNDEPVTVELCNCVRMQLLRKCLYSTEIKIRYK